MADPLLSSLFSQLDIVVLSVSSDQKTIAIADLPTWFSQIFPEENVNHSETTNPFLLNFIEQADAHWKSQNPNPLRSGEWVEITSEGTEFYLEASACSINETPLLLIENLGTAYLEKLQFLQKARTHLLTHEKLSKEIQLREILLHCIVHDLHGPLNNISMALNMFETSNLTKEQLRFREIALSQIKKQETLIQQILEIFKTEQNTEEAAPSEPFSLKETVQHVLHTFQETLKKKKIQIKLEAPHSSSTSILANSGRIERVIYNLISNAQRYSPRDSTITLVIEEKEKTLLFKVQDEGSGIPPGSETQLFEKFHQAPGKKGKIGLGLYYCRITIEKFQGTIGANNLPSGGACFWFELPKAI